MELNTTSTASSDAKAPVLLTEKDLAVRWSLSLQKLRRDRWQRGGVPFIKIGRLVRYSVEAVEEYERRHVILGIEGGPRA